MPLTRYFACHLPRQKLRSTTFSQLVMALPLAIFITLLILLGAYQTSLSRLLQEQVIPVLSRQASLITLDKEGYTGQLNSESATFTADEHQQLQRDLNLKSVWPLQPLPNLISQTSVGESNQPILLANFYALDTAAGQQFSSTTFNYTPRQPIPLILGSQSWQEWNDITAATPATSKKKKQQLIDRFDHRQTLLDTYNQPKVIAKQQGQLLTLNFSLINQPPIFHLNKSTTPSTYNYLTDQQKEHLQQQTQKLVSRFWDYQRLSQGVDIEFKVVAIDSHLQPQAAIIPTTAIKPLYAHLNQHLQQATKARQAAILPDSFAGLELPSSPADSSPIDPSQFLITESLDQPTTLYIPGLLYQSTTAGHQLVNWPIDWSNQFSSPTRHLLLQLKNPDQATDVLIQLNQAGYQKVNYHSTLPAAQSFGQLLQNFNSIFWPILTIITILGTLLLAARQLKNDLPNLTTIKTLGASQVEITSYLLGQLFWPLLPALLIGLTIGVIATIATQPLFSHLLTRTDIFSLQSWLGDYHQTLTLNQTNLFIWPNQTIIIYLLQTILWLSASLILLSTIIGKLSLAKLTTSKN